MTGQSARTPRQDCLIHRAGVVAVAMWMAAVPTAAAQASDLTQQILADTACSDADAGAKLRANIAAMEPALDELTRALDDISLDTRVCGPFRSAAVRLLSELDQEDTGQTPEEARAALQRMERALREADADAALMTFQVGPPPRNLTRDAGTRP